MRGQGWIVALAVAAVLLGALFLKGLAEEPPSDPTASVDNGAPAGLLAMSLWLNKRGVVVEVRRSFDAPWPEGPALLVVPPPEASTWSDKEVAAVMERVREGTLAVLLVCDEDMARARRSGPWWGGLGVSCSPLGDTEREARGTMPAYPYTLFARGSGRVGSVGEALAVPAYVDDNDDVVVLRRPSGEGFVTVLSSGSVISNDGLAEGDNAAFLLSLVPEGGRVVVDESHHSVRGAEVLEKAFDQTGPRVGGLAMLLLVPFVLFGFAPRRGDPPPKASGPEAAAARAQARALAALYRDAGVSPAAQPALDPAPSPDRRSPP